LITNLIIVFPGDHSVEVKIGETHVEGSPFLLKAYDAAKVKVTDVQSGVVGKPVFFSSKYSNFSIYLIVDIKHYIMIFRYVIL
jgi:hypothetical protein